MVIFFFVFALIITSRYYDFFPPSILIVSLNINLVTLIIIVPGACKLIESNRIRRDLKVTGYRDSSFVSMVKS